MLGFDDLTPEQRKQLAKLSTEIAEEIEKEERWYQEQLDSIMTLEKYRKRKAELLEKMRNGKWP